jgi:hypothetical protein
MKGVTVTLPGSRCIIFCFPGILADRKATVTLTVKTLGRTFFAALLRITRTTGNLDGKVPSKYINSYIRA